MKQLLLLIVAASLAPGAELRFSLAGDPKTFDPLHVSEENSEIVRALTAGTLVRINRLTDVVEPQLAEWFRVGGAGSTITFHLRPGLKFSDGSPLTTADVAHTLTTALDPKQASPKGDTLRSEKGDPTFTITSPLEITVKYPAPRPDVERLFDALSIIPAKMDRIPASAGPFHVTEYRPGESVRLERNAYYWKRPALDSILMDIQPNRDIEVTRFLRGETQLINKLEPENFDRVAKASQAGAHNIGPSLDSEFLWFNQAPSTAVPDWKRVWFRSVAFRHAVSRAIRRDDIARIVYRGYAHPAAGPISPANKAWFNADLKPLPYDEAGAMKLLTAEGFRLEGGVLKDSSGHVVEFSLITQAGNRVRQAIAAVIQDDLKRIGIRVNIVALDFNSLIERIMRTAQYEACLLGFSSVSIEPSEEMNVWLSSGANHAWWPLEKTPATPWEARIDQLELSQATERSREARRKAIGEMQKIVVDQEPIIYLVNPDYLAAYSPRLKGVQPVVVTPQLLWNIEALRLE